MKTHVPCRAFFKSRVLVSDGIRYEKLRFKIKLNAVAAIFQLPAIKGI